MYYCEFCGREMKRKIVSHGHIFCNKHYKQFKKYGKVLDNNPRTLQDKNEYHVDGEITYIDLYDKDCNVIAQVIIDTEDLDKVKNIKWKLSSSGYAMNTPKQKGKNKHMTRVILETDEFVDHINHNTLDNRKKNLRIITKSQNQMNVDYRGVDLNDKGKYIARIKINQKAIYLGSYIDREEAFYARWYAEKVLFKEYRYPKEEPIIPEARKEGLQKYVVSQLNKYVDEKVQRL